MKSSVIFAITLFLWMLLVCAICLFASHKLLGDVIYDYKNGTKYRYSNNKSQEYVEYKYDDNTYSRTYSNGKNEIYYVDPNSDVIIVN